MKILIITMNVGRTAPGIVFERLIYGLSKHHTIDVITSDYDPGVDLSDVKNIIDLRLTHLNSKISKLLLTLFAVDVSAKIWAKKTAAEVRRRNLNDYDLVFSFASYGHYAAAMAGNKISSQLGIRHFVYSVDAIPPPVGWLKNDMFYKSIKKLAANLFRSVDGIFSANHKMLKYQTTTFKPKKNIIKGVIYNPSFGEVQQYPELGDESNMFLYTGGIYGPRKIDYILAAFRNVFKEYPNVVIEFVGTKLNEEVLSNFTADERKAIVVHPFAKDLTPFYKRATALLDIDAELEDDIFLSSKITNYININRVIISETGTNSPSHQIFKNIGSILQCGHNVEEITNAMRRAINTKNKVDFSDREEVINLFKLENVVAEINKVIDNEN
ncbi:hypothetical protein INP83_08045 [Mucilaginibacter sp. 21P]|uniref:hypothetical protein n=1 Tax=Mucilaginibacter sp. 21P TaxID=2778902 RepID=UPI001C5A2BD6|nr:hypothetical protein [Mucilaginibacter sp. 21P]QXV67018.1 hypothetical protein INP83_08045 [Mucilaginibacter sp. 21P]